MTKNDRRNNFIISARVVAIPMTFEEFCDAYNITSTEYEFWDKGYAVELTNATTVFIDEEAFNQIAIEDERVHD